MGLVDAAAKIFAAGAYAPLDVEMREALAALFEMRWPGVEGELSARERSAYRRIGLPESPDFFVDRPDYCVFFTDTGFYGVVL